MLFWEYHAVWSKDKTVFVRLLVSEESEVLKMLSEKKCVWESVNIKDKNIKSEA